MYITYEKLFLSALVIFRTRTQKTKKASNFSMKENFLIKNQLFPEGVKDSLKVIFQEMNSFFNNHVYILQAM